MLLRVHDQRDTPGGDQAIRPDLTWDRIFNTDPGIYGAGRSDGTPIMPPRVPDAWNRQLPIAGRVARDLERGLDPVLTGSGFETTPEDYWRQGQSAIDRLLQYMRQPYGPTGAKPTIPLMESWR